MARNNYFQFKQFRIIQERSAMKVGMDGVLIGAWAKTYGAERILDVGTGTGLIALMMAQKNNLAIIDAIEIDPAAFQEASENIQLSNWSKRINIELCSFQEYAKQTKLKYDLIVSNPPFFTNGVKAPNESRSQARHSDQLPLEFLISEARKLLTENGRIALILPFERLEEVENLANINQLFKSRLCPVKPNPKKSEFRIMIEFQNSTGNLIQENLMIEFENHHDYTPEYRDLTKDFYIRF